MIRRREERKTRRQGGAAQRFKIIQQAGEGAYRKALGSATVRVASYTDHSRNNGHPPCYLAALILLERSPVRVPILWIILRWKMLPRGLNPSTR